MLSTDENKPGGKSGQRNRKAAPQNRKAERNRKSDQQQTAKPDQKPDQLQEVGELIVAPIVSTDNPDAALPAADTSPAATSPAEAVVPAEVAPVSLQTIANAYGDYTKKSFEQTMSFFGRLANVRSFDKAFELQTEFAKQAYENFVAESQKIRELHGELARQRLMRFEGYVARMTQTAQAPARHT
jgi:hypothetical protein